MTDACLLLDAGELRAAPGGCKAAAHQGRLQQGAVGGVQGRGLRPAQQRRQGQVSGPRHLQGQGGGVTDTVEETQSRGCQHLLRISVKQQQKNVFKIVFLKEGSVKEVTKMAI